MSSTFWSFQFFKLLLCQKSTQAYFYLKGAKRLKVNYAEKDLLETISTVRKQMIDIK